MGSENRKRKRRRSYIGYIIVIVLLLTLVLLLVYEHFFPRKRLPAGVWIHEMDISNDIETAAGEWLYPDTGGSMTGEAGQPGEPVCLKLVLSINSDGTYEQYVDEDSYVQAKDAAYRYFREELCEYINSRFMAAGMTDSNGMSADDIESLMVDAVGMGSEEYLKKTVPDIVMPYDHYSAEYSDNGTCRVEDGLICFDDSAGTEYIFDDNRLLLGDVVYQKLNDDR